MPLKVDLIIHGNVVDKETVLALCTCLKPHARLWNDKDSEKCTECGETTRPPRLDLLDALRHAGDGKTV